MRVVLASASPARLSVLRAAGVRPEVRVSGVAEETITAPDPAALVLALARAKAAAVVRPEDDDLLVLGCDSLLDLDGSPYGKGTGDGGRRTRVSFLSQPRPSPPGPTDATDPVRLGAR